MVWARLALVGGIVIVCAAFAVGTEHQSSVLVQGQSYSCGRSIAASWLVSGTPDPLSARPSGSADTRHGHAECRSNLVRSRIVVLTTMGLGGLIALIGWTGVDRRRGSETPGPALAPVT